MQNKQRHGCLTAWLTYLMISYSIVSLGLFFNSDIIVQKFQYIKSENLLLTIASIAILNVLFIFMLLKWFKLGFWGLLCTSTLLFIIQIINTNNILTPIITAIVILIIYGLLKLKKRNVSVWDNLE
jgi:hypothetical protein